MPRLAVLADIHGNRPAFQAVLADLERHAPIDRLLVAGDIVMGPGQAEILRRLVELNAVMIRGNVEHLLADMLTDRAADYFFTARQFESARWAIAHLSGQAREILCRLPEQAVYQHPGADPIRLVHGSPRHYERQIHPDRPGQLEDQLALVPEPVLACGHSHHPWQAVRRAEAGRASRLAFNPGAVNFPQTGYVGAQYAILDWVPGGSDDAGQSTDRSGCDACGRSDGRGRWVVRHFQVPYDLAALRREYTQSGYLDSGPYARVILQSVLTGQDLIPPFFSLLHRLRTRAGCVEQDYYPDEIWQRAAAEFPGWQELERP